MYRVKIPHNSKPYGYVGIVATAIGLSIFLRKKLKNHGFNSVLAESTDSDSDGGIASSLHLQLKQVQVFFRHGARTPLYVLEGYQQMPYHLELVMRPHQHTLFPLKRVSDVTLEPVDWSPYEYHLRGKDLLQGGAMTGQLTGFGQEQMYLLGRRIKESYREQLSLDSYHPDTTYLLSTNITRTVESARCVLAGVFGKEELKNYATKHGPVPFYLVGTSHNILIPDTGRCRVLRDVNHASMLHFDVNQRMREDRERIEKYIDEKHDEHQDVLAKAQKRLNEYFAASTNSKQKGTSRLSFNSDRQLFDCDPVLISLLNERNLAIDQVEGFWQNVISNHPLFAQNFPKEEKQALAYLRKIEVEEFTQNLSKGHRFKFHFGVNPYFYNTTLCKEITQLPNSSSSSTKSTPIKWKHGHDFSQKHKSNSPDSPATISFFSWLMDPGHIQEDTVGIALKEEIWKNPLDFYRHVSYAMDHSTTKKINFVFFRDDMVARETHGWWYPPDLLHYKSVTNRNGTEMMYQAMTGRHSLERPVVTKLSVGRLLKDMVERMEANMGGSSKTRLVLYSSHDSTMVALLEALGIWDNTWPPFGCDVRLEMYQNEEDKHHYVRVLYNGEAKKLRGQERFFMKWSEFTAAIKPYIIDQENFERICASSFLEEVAEDILVHEAGEKQEDEESVKTSETPAGM